MAEYKTINEITNVSTQANDDDLLIMWDKAREKTVKIKNKDFNKNNQPKTLETPIEVDNVEETTVEGALGAINDKVKNFTAGVAFKGTRSAYNTAKLIPEGSDGHIPSGALVIITDEGKTYVTNGTGSSQTLELVANATFNGSHAEWNNLTPAQKAMYNIVNFDDDEGSIFTEADYDVSTSNYQVKVSFRLGMLIITVASLNEQKYSNAWTEIADLSSIIPQGYKIKTDVTCQNSITFWWATGAIVGLIRVNPSKKVEVWQYQNQSSDAMYVFGQLVVPLDRA